VVLILGLDVAELGSGGKLQVLWFEEEGVKKGLKGVKIEEARPLYRGVGTRLKTV
jgi:hypothetical protein